MSDSRSRIAEDTDEYQELCVRFGEKPQWDEHGPNPYSVHAATLRRRAHTEYEATIMSDKQKEALLAPAFVAAPAAVRQGEPVTGEAVLNYDMTTAPVGGPLLVLTRGGLLVRATLTATDKTSGHYWAWCKFPKRDKEEEKRRGLQF